MTGPMIYGALAAKAKAMYGKRLRFADFERLAAMDSEAQVLDALRQHPGWRQAAARIRPAAGGYIGRVELEAALREQLYLDYTSLLHFVPRQDKALMAGQVLLGERDALLNTLRRLKAGKYALPMPPVSQAVGLGKVDAKALETCTDYDGLLAAARSSIYCPVLTHLRPQQPGTLPDYTVAESLLRAVYFSHMHRLVEKNYRGQVKRLLLRAFGEQVDLLNILHILRLKTYFPDTPMDVYLVTLFPFNYRLRPEFTRSLCAAPDAAGVFDLLRQSAYAGSFENVAVGEVEDYYRRAMYAFNVRQLMGGPPCIYTPLAYLHLREMELEVLINVIESVKYQVPYHTQLARLVGA
jgi:V/A-type H+-transporting ATPase subunit C